VATVKDEIVRAELQVVNQVGRGGGGRGGGEESELERFTVETIASDVHIML